MGRHRRNANQRYHDRISGRYEAIYDDVYWQWHDLLTWEHLRRFLHSDLAQPVVDLGCGSGKWGRKLLKSGYKVTFVDLAVKMVDEARKQVAETGCAEKAEFVQADLMDLSKLGQGRFGLAVAMGEPLGSTDDPAHAMREVARCLAPGGILVATLDNRIACVDYYVQRGDVEAVEEFLRTGRTRWLTRNESERFAMHTFTPDGLTKMLAHTGLEVVDVIGKTVLPMRQHRELLNEAKDRRRWARLEQRLSNDPANWGRCAHLQVAAIKEA